MSSYQNNQGPYNRIPEAGTTQEIESWGLIEAARRIADSIAAGDYEDKAVRDDRRDALRRNWRLWTIFQAELTSQSGDQFPEDIRLNMLTLCQFIDKHTVKCIETPDADDMRVFIDINRNIAAGIAAMPKPETPNSVVKTETATVQTENKPFNAEI